MMMMIQDGKEREKKKDAGKRIEEVEHSGISDGIE